MPEQQSIDLALDAYEASRHELSIFMKGIESWFASHPRLTGGSTPTVHSVKSRLKDSGHLRDKIVRKHADGELITAENLFVRVTDLAGVRVLHLYQEQSRAIHAAIIDKVENQRDWVFNEPPKAYTWDPEAQGFFANMGLEVQVKDSFYTSVHYLVRPRRDSQHCCEIQVRTLFEEIWGEVDHTLNYPTPTDSVSCHEQLRVLTKVVGAGSRLVDSIFRTAASAPNGQ
jgi:ppGpp synthetase/RelA/SpoT-type nucleotidyltranferase